jgi:hypothetical protein
VAGASGVSAFEVGQRVRFKQTLHSITTNDDYEVCTAPEQRGAHLLTWVRKVAVGVQPAFGVRAVWLRRVEEVVE